MSLEKMIADRSQRKSLPDGSELLVRIALQQDDGGNDHVRAEAFLLRKEATHFIGGVDIVPYPHNPLFSAIPHSSDFPSKGLILSVTTALAGAIGPIVGECLGSEGIQGRYKVRRSIETKMEQLVVTACAATETQLATFNIE